MEKSIIIWAWDAWQQLYLLISQKEKILGFFDDFEKGPNILGSVLDSIEYCKQNKIDKVYFAIPSLENKLILSKVIKFSRKNDLKLLILPSVLDIIEWEVKTDYLRSVEFEDLLFRPIRKSNIDKNKEFFEWKTVMISGAAWTIWSELVKQSLRYWAKFVVWFDHSEIWVFDQMKNFWLLTWEWSEFDGKLALHIKSIRDKPGIDFLFKKYKPDIVFNAAAYKHVYQMEINPDEAIKTDIVWLKNIIEISIKNDVENFCQISTDKAVNPTNIMWASKRIWELLIHYYSEHQDKMKLNAVRFWNVLWSSGSVLTIFKKQIELWNNITVTHKDIVRYFMSIEEAVNLVITTTTLKEKWKIFVLDMWDPVNIYNLAKRYIKLSNAKGIGINIIWLKPWEKLYEELILDKEQDYRTVIDKIFITEDKWKYENILQEIDKFKNDFDIKSILKKMKNILPEFQHKYNEA